MWSPSQKEKSLCHICVLSCRTKAGLKSHLDAHRRTTLNWRDGKFLSRSSNHMYVYIKWKFTAVFAFHSRKKLSGLLHIHYFMYITRWYDIVYRFSEFILAMFNIWMELYSKVWNYTYGSWATQMCPCFIPVIFLYFTNNPWLHLRHCWSKC